MPDKLTIGLDIGGTKMAFAVVDSSGNICDETVIPTEHDNPYEVTISRIAEQLNTYLDQYPNIFGIGIGVPGPVDNERGIALNAVNLLWENRPIKSDLLENLSRSVPLYIENDVNVGAIGEHLFGRAKETPNFVYLSIGTGLGGAVMLDGKLMRGSTSAEMEIGHISLDPVNGLLCTCGQRGCVEMSMSGKGLVATTKAHYERFADTQMTLDTLSTYDIIHYANHQDTLAQFVMNEAAVALGLSCVWCTMLFNPSLIVLGGGLIHATYDLLKTQTLATMKRVACRNHMMLSR
ncbi:MAG: ROK family protein [Anaerolineae bacterium]|nr:ROK family protein [Anaerolineae bacterium]